MKHGGAKRKGARIEREIVDRHRAMGIRAERYPLSGASHFRGSGHDVDVYAFGADQAPLVAEVKGRKTGKGFTTLEAWLGDYDLLFLRRNQSEPMVVMSWTTWQRIVTFAHCGNPDAEKCDEQAAASNLIRPDLGHFR